MKYFKVFATLFFVCSLAGCAKKETFNNTGEKVGESRVIFFPIMTLTGDRYVAVNAGGSFTDPGAVGTVGDTEVPVTVAGNVNTNTPGVYTVTYTASNSDGFSASVIRTVVVYSTDASAAANDFSGTYLRTSNGVASTWSKLAPGVYKVVNPGGATSGTGLTAVAINPTGITIKIPSQVTSDGSVSSSADEVYTNSAPAKYTWRFFNPTYGTGLRTFVKQ